MFRSSGNSAPRISENSDPRRLTAFPDPDAAMKAPRPAAKPIPSHVRDMTAALDSLKSESLAKQTQLESQIEAARQLQNQLDRLQREVDDSSDALAIGDSQRSDHESTILAVEHSVLSVWGRDDSARHISTPSHQSQRVACYTSVLVARAAIKDYDERVRPILAAQVTQAQEALSKFQQANRLS